jgi:DNA-binding response OmpR family regulator
LPSRSSKLLCAGKDLSLLRTRCAILTQNGYDARPATLQEAEILLRSEQFDLVVVSAWLDDWDRVKLLSAVGRTPSYVLPGLTLAAELLKQVEQRLPAITCEGLATMTGDVLL